MSEPATSSSQWAAIVYGRSYHLDFRFITIPQDFERQEIAWASSYIIATTQKARNLATSPRWSLFKNNSHCVIGVTCMVRDLIGKLGEDLIEVMAKDDLGRPLYVFVGYVTRLEENKNLMLYPAYTGDHLPGFRPLYRDIEKVWLVRDYDQRQPFFSEYKSFDKNLEVVSAVSEPLQVLSLNHKLKCPDKTFVWQSSSTQNNQLWRLAAQFSQPTSICLSVKGKSLVDSPFLNQSITEIGQFTIQKRIDSGKQNNLALADKNSNAKSKKPLSFKDKISNRAKDDLNLTLQQAAKVSSASQEIISNFTQLSSTVENLSEKTPSSSIEKQDDFGFKTKKKPLPSPKQDWF